MDPITGLMNGFSVALQPINLMWAFVGTLLGTAVGVLPGIGPALTIALLLPVTACVATSRVVLGLHYPSDVLAATVIGIGLAALALWVVPGVSLFV